MARRDRIDRRVPPLLLLLLLLLLFAHAQKTHRHSQTDPKGHARPAGEPTPHRVPAPVGGPLLTEDPKLRNPVFSYESLTTTTKIYPPLHRTRHPMRASLCNSWWLDLGG